MRPPALSTDPARWYAHASYPCTGLLMHRLILVPLACVALFACANKTRVPLDGAEDAEDVELDVAHDVAASPDIGDAALDTAPADASDVDDGDALVAPEDADADASADVILDTSPEDVATNRAPICAAGCRLDGAGDPPSAEVAGIPFDVVRCSADGTVDPDGDALAFDWS